MNSRMALFSASLPDWGAQEVIEIARTLGFPAIEWGAGPGEAIADLGMCAEIRARCAELGIGCSGLSIQDPATTLASPERALAAVDLAVALGSPHVRLRAPAYGSDRLRRQRQLARRGLTALVERAAPHGVAVLVETSPGTLAPTPESALALIEEHAPAHAGVLYDPGNMIIEGHVEPCLAIAHLREYLVHVHVKNVGWCQRNGTWEWQYSRLSDGMVDWPRIVTALAAAGYVGRFSIDHLPGPPTETLLRSEAEELSHLIDGAFLLADP
jgi:sugar phosphate isomerase/epimerase